ncbi:MAG: tripartite tricarboxylate transporter substrate-binding protein [Pseudomonadales bacterium]|jgi:putative tricarboxylic transport membrane protein
MRASLRLLCFAVLLGLSGAAARASEPLHLLIPAGPGGGLDTTARALGDAVLGAGVRAPVSYENMTGGGGGRAMAYFIETAQRQHGTLLVNSTPLIVRSLQGLFPHSYHDVIPVAGLIGDYGAFVVRADSAIDSWQTLVGTLRQRPGAVTFGGGSVRGSLDHIVLALALSGSGLDPRAGRYLPYDAGGKAMLALLGGEVDVLSTGVGETLSYLNSGDVRVLALTSSTRLPLLPEVPTLTELGVPVDFANWRGVFAAPGTPEDVVTRLTADVRAATETGAWQKSLARYGWTSLDLYGDAFTRYLDAQQATLARTLTELGFIRR